MNPRVYTVKMAGIHTSAHQPHPFLASRQLYIPSHPCSVERIPVRGANTKTELVAQSSLLIGIHDSSRKNGQLTLPNSTYSTPVRDVSFLSTQFTVRATVQGCPKGFVAHAAGSSKFPKTLKIRRMLNDPSV